MTETDASFRQMFVQEAGQRLDRMGELLLRLETEGSDQATVAALFREAHTLKGAAAMVGHEDMRRIAHAMEDLLDTIRGGSAALTPERIDTLFGHIDAARSLLTGEAETTSPPFHPPHPSPPASTVPSSTPAAAVSESAMPPATANVVQVSLARLDQLVGAAGESIAAHLRLGRLIASRLGSDPTELAEFRQLQAGLNRVRELTMLARMVPVATLGYSLHRAVREVARAQSKAVRWDVVGGETELDRAVLEQLADPLLHLVRNAVAHGIESPVDRAAAGKPSEGMVQLQARQLGSDVVITVSDDGQGIDLRRIREQALRQSIDTASMQDDEALSLIFKPGFSTATAVTEISGRGVGLDVVRSSLESVRGRVDVRTELGKGTEFRLSVPITLAVVRCLLIECAGLRLGIPIHSVVKVLQSSALEPTQADGRQFLMAPTGPVPFSSLATVLGLQEQPEGPVMMLVGPAGSHAFRVDAIAGQRDLAIKGLGASVPHLEVVAGASLEPDGSIIAALDASRLIERANALGHGRESQPTRADPILAHDLVHESRHQADSVLVVDDAMTIRELEKGILERAGYRVRTATNGAEALALLAAEPSTLVLTDVEMPEMDGFGLIEAIRRHPRLAHVPVIILSAQASEADRRRGLEVGADGYILKSAFDQTGLLAAVNRLLGKAA
jgi:two-component system, chemotaxis family, sensor kinase CheA